MPKAATVRPSRLFERGGCPLPARDDLREREGYGLALLQILEDRYNKKPVVIAAFQLPVQNWHESLGEPTIADAIMDRLAAAAHVLDLKGDSLRKKLNKN